MYEVTSVFCSHVSAKNLVGGHEEDLSESPTYQITTVMRTERAGGWGDSNKEQRRKKVKVGPMLG